MFRFMHVVVVILLGCFIFTACAKAPQPSGGGEQKTNVVMCNDPRPEMCTREYRPVCGMRRDASEKTYSNGCTACSDKDVVSYRSGACEQEK